MVRFPLSVSVVGALLATAAFPSSSPMPEPNLEAFWSELQAALTAADPVALCPLVQFPLRVNEVDGSTTLLGNPRALQTHFDRVFSPAVRAAILDSKNGFIHRTSGIGIGDGTVWADLFGAGEGQHYRIFVVNLPGGQPATSKPRLEFVCDARNHRVVVDSVSGTLRYRAWNRPRSLTEAPDLEIAGGTVDMDGTPPCDGTEWTFTRGDTRYSLGTLSCLEAGDGGEAIGELRVEVAGELLASWYCY